MQLAIRASIDVAWETTISHLIIIERSPGTAISLQACHNISPLIKFYSGACCRLHRIVMFFITSDLAMEVQIWWNEILSSACDNVLDSTALMALCLVTILKCTILSAEVAHGLLFFLLHRLHSSVTSILADQLSSTLLESLELWAGHIGLLERRHALLRLRVHVLLHIDGSVGHLRLIVQVAVSVQGRLAFWDKTSSCCARSVHVLELIYFTTNIELRVGQRLSLAPHVGATGQLFQGQGCTVSGIKAGLWALTRT